MGAQVEEAEAALEALRRRIKDEHARMEPPREVWFWPERDGVKGFLGTAPVTVMGLNPSTGGAEEPYEFFYRCLREEGLPDAHITDLCKIVARLEDRPLLLYHPPTLTLHRDYLVEEAAIVRPAVMLVMGDLTLDVLRGLRLVVRKGQQFVFVLPSGGSASVLPTVHPAAARYTKRTADRQARFRRDVQAARQAMSTGTDSAD